MYINTIKRCNKTPSSRNIHKETIDLSICKPEFFCNCENNQHVAATISSDCFSIPPLKLFESINVSLWQNSFFVGVAGLKRAR